MGEAELFSGGCYDGALQQPAAGQASEAARSAYTAGTARPYRRKPASRGSTPHRFQVIFAG
jgi:hypothetical protein